ncbi:SRPBCC family protein [Sinosporangium siamense]|uniref:Cyclase n=1 Tax=Sinosporangium siamense TaxID=1367973 RepID=A0A919V8V3_9ACTN|nr:SRPBCC family protein [Sinosporangium siamense]GII96525.1 cyclase [Sinosporangium siamense]
MSTITQSVDVAVPVRTAYNQWTQFESFPHFMEGVESVVQHGDTMTHWKIKIGGVEREFDARITEQRPDEKIAWASIAGPRHAGVVTFHALRDGGTRVSLELETEPEGAAENLADAAGLLSHRVKGDLQRFARFIEHRGQESGGWRGEVPPPPAV